MSFLKVNEIGQIYISKMENLTQKGEIGPGEQATFGMQGNAIKEEPCDQYSSYCCQPVNGATSDKGVRTEYVDEKTIKTECEDLVHDDTMQISKGSTSEYLTVWKAEKHEGCEANVILGNGIDRKDNISEVAAVKKEQCDHLIVSDSGSEDNHGFNGDEMVELLTQRSDYLTAQLRAVCKELKEEKETEMDMSEMRSSSTLHTDDTNPRADSHTTNSYSMWVEVEPETGSEKNGEGNQTWLHHRRAPHTDSNGFQDNESGFPGQGQKRKLIYYGDSLAKGLDIELQTVDKLNLRRATEVGEENHPGPLTKSHDIFSCDKCYLAFSDPAYLLKHMRRIHHCGYCEQQSNSKTTERTHENFHGKESNTAIVRSSGINNSIPAISSMEVQRLETEKLNVVSFPGENHLTEQNTIQQVAQGCDESTSISDIKQCQNMPICSKTCAEDNTYEHSDSESRQEYDHLQPIQKLHMGEKSYKCDVCDGGFARRSHLQVHKRIHTGEKPYKCDICGAGFTHAGNLTCHKRIHTGEKPHKCDVCGAGFVQTSQLKVHKRIHTGEKPYKCDVCGVAFVQTGQLKVHKRIHTGEKPYKCDVCDAGFADKSALQVHKRKHTGEKPYKCDVCGLGFVHQGDLLVHKRRHTGEKPYKCDVCGAAFAQAGHLQRHKIIHSAEKPYKCDVCGVGFYRKDNLLDHKRIHSGETLYKCDVCDLNFVRAGELKAHRRIHTGEKPYKCDVCSVSFARAHHLQGHQRKHTGEKPYKCDVCSEGFAHTHNLHVHKRMHTGEKPYKCDVCSVGFARKGDLKVHQRIHTGEKPYRCEVCGVGFARRHHLQGHKRTHE